MKIRVWLDSGANIHSNREVIVDLEDEMNISEEEWEEMSEEEKERTMREVAFEQSDWGFEVIE